MQIGKGCFSEKKKTTTQYDLADKSHKRAEKLQIFKNDQLLKKL